MRIVREKNGIYSVVSFLYYSNKQSYVYQARHKLNRKREEQKFSEHFLTKLSSDHVPYQFVTENFIFFIYCRQQLRHGDVIF